jgi:DNA-binding response OmpR family regulator
MAASHVTSGPVPAQQLSSTWTPYWGGRAPLTLLVADPEPDACSELSNVHRVDMMDIAWCRNGAQALVLAGQLSPEVVFLCPQLQGVALPCLISALREHTKTAVVLGIGAGDVEAVGPALQAGAVAVINRPFLQRELDSLLGSYLAQAQRRIDERAVITLGELELDSPAFEARAGGEPLDLTLREFELLRYLMTHGERVVTADQIREAVWGARGESVTANTIAVHIGRLRARLHHVADLISVRGVGYRLTVHQSGPRPD